MAGRGEREYEVNEVSWWSNWSTATWLTDGSFVLRSRYFDEPFFNRAGLLAPPKDVQGFLSRAERLFRLAGRKPCFFVQESRSYGDLRDELAARGYRSADKMSVMELGSPSLRSGEVEVDRITPEEHGVWAGTYLLSFYGETSLLEGTLKAIKKAAKGGATLLLAKHGGEPVGTLAAYRSAGKVGAYCVGTLPGFRNRGVARAMLKGLYDLARDEGRNAILQTVLSDSVEPLYVKLGFRRVYLKESYLRPGSDHPAAT